LSHQAVLAEAAGLGRVPDSLQIEKKEFIYRSHIGLGEYDVPKSEITDNAPTGQSPPALRFMPMGQCVPRPTWV
jgi:hypothetical protein